MLSKFGRLVAGSPSVTKLIGKEPRKCVAISLRSVISSTTDTSELSNICRRRHSSTTTRGSSSGNILSTTLSLLIQQDASSTVRSLSTQAMDDENDKYEDEFPTDDNRDTIHYSVQVSQNGQYLCITPTNQEANNNNITAWTFAAPLLWVNDPKSIHPSSGQRTRTLGQYDRRAAIRNGRIVVGFLEGDNSSRIHPPPLPGSFHPRGGIYKYQNHNYNSAGTATKRELLQIEWVSGEVSYFDLSWLANHANLGRMGWRMSLEEMDAVEQALRTQTAQKSKNWSTPVANSLTITTSDSTRVTKDIAIQYLDSTINDVTTSIPTLEYNDVMDHQDAVFHAMQGIYEYGAILVRNAPILIEDDHRSTFNDPLFQKEQESVVGKLGKTLSDGALSHGSLYGDIFHVQSKLDAENIAYTSVGLPPHQDLTYYESKPFLQLLHCVSNGSIVGGESVLIDVMAAAEELRHLAPDMFEVLCRTEATFLKERAGADMVSPKPHIRTDPSLGHVVEINWSPPFEGPLQVMPSHSMEDYVRAYQALEIMLNDRWNEEDEGIESLLPKELETELKEYARRYTWEYPLQRGDVLVFNNQRMLHGRREFTPVGNGQRHLIGCYTDAMDTTSRYRQLLRERGGTGGGGYGKRNPGSGCRWI
ncbi:taurine catabolism dioxygenase TauD/TfdA family protein [Nitzschia inconspicua]|uniref:Taurine catabolism dioxygenase TauD/TfdA family protein n=1 Tax=Nitzschia inconspicua TaxID=303405 RepID=A0A9K3LCE7_9STRA|nr:taurine catabolism dioxygenase TauD/TfdA family protein [Nitzschia inconspicua]KAG7359537.1 taurine catabolism dioxygenase TauD/TfdA family protein [Nitzschia inconspicua]